MANIQAMAASGDLVLAGPLTDEGPLVEDSRGCFLRGVFVFRGTDEKHLREIAAPDAAIQAGRLVPVPFGLMLDPKTGKIRVRYVDLESEAYQTLNAYMIRLKKEDFENSETVTAIAKAGNLTETEFVARFKPTL